MSFKSKRCRMIIPLTGERCRQPSLKGKEFCRFHVEAGEAGLASGAERVEMPKSECVEDRIGESEGESRDTSETTPAAKNRLSTSGEKAKRGAQPENRNARRHGLFSTRMPLEEKELYEENKRLFAEQLVDLNTFDELVVHLLALVSTKLDVAAAGGASPQSIIPLSNEVLRLLRSLKETRDSRDEEDTGVPKTFADFLAEAETLAEGLVVMEDDARKRVVELEREVNELRRQLKLPPKEGSEHRKTLCARCGKETSQHLNLVGEWICLACGVDAGSVSGSTGAGASAKSSSKNKKTAPKKSSKASKASSAAKGDKPKRAEPKSVESKPSAPSHSWAAIPPTPRND